MTSKRCKIRQALQRPKSFWLLLALLPSIARVGDAIGQTSREVPPEDVRELVADLKEDPRGPFQAIRWFCPDGSILPAQTRCPAPGGNQHGLLKTSVERLATTNHLFLGQVLAGVDNSDFLDKRNAFSRLKQYQIERYLARSDDGWILRRARFYRGAFQAEDEESWSRQFLEWMLADDRIVLEHFFLAREASRDLPSAGSENLVQKIRATSKEISDAFPPFLDIRVKIHGQPEASDTTRVLNFLASHSSRLSDGMQNRFDALLADLRRHYRSDPATRLQALSQRIAPTSRLKSMIDGMSRATAPAALVELLARIAVQSRQDIERATSGRDRLRLMDVSLEAEAYAFRVAGSWKPATVANLMAKFYALADLALASGLVEWWESELIAQPPSTDTLAFDTFERYVAEFQRVVGWGIGMVTAHYEREVERFRTFEPMASGFIDDKMRSTALLALGETAGRLASELAERSGRTHNVMGLPRQGGIRGLNPGVAVGELIVHSGGVEDIDFRSDAIYILARAPADLKPVAGIATVTEGNLVSHVQLLARNLGIPNAVVAPELLSQLSRFSGTRVFYAVSPRGTVTMKPASEMTASERRLIEDRRKSDERIRVPVNRIDFEATALASLYDLRAGDSGRVCGPKAANLGQLSTLFPNRVAPGFIVPFGVFRDHMNQQIPGRSHTYWSLLTAIFAEAEQARSNGKADAEIETTVIARLTELQRAIESMPLKATLVQSIKSRFQDILGGSLGTVPVFVRSDTNMEDLKDFTGAGLNLTIPNVVSESDILQAIRRVWASPYRERGYRWRQKYLLNPQDVYPSLLILKSVNVDKSGVMITTGVASGNQDHYTVAFNRGVGGAVDGQAAEMYELSEGSYDLLSPAREPLASTLPETGGVKKVPVDFRDRILSIDNLRSLQDIGANIRRRLPGTPGIETTGPFDVELGFLDDHVWLFQTRPFVENRSAAQSSYLSLMDMRDRNLKSITMTDRLVSSN